MDLTTWCQSSFGATRFGPVSAGLARKLAEAAGARGFETELVARSRDFFNEDRFVRREGGLIPLDVPSDAGFAVHRGRLFVTPRAGWETGGRTFPAGSAFSPSASTAILDRLLHHSHVLNIKGRSYRLRDLEQAISLRQ